jgi:hypothetical protein
MATPILKSRRFWTAVVTAIVSTVLYLIGQYDPEQLPLTKTLLEIWLPLGLTLIAAFTAEDVATINADAKKHVANQSLAEAHVYAVADKVSTATVIPTVIDDPVITPQP